LEVRDWPFAIYRSDSLVIYQACRFKATELLKDLVPLNLYNNNNGQAYTIWVPEVCAQESAFHQSHRHNHVNINELIIGFNYPEQRINQISDGTKVFFHGLAMGRVRWHELYVGQCQGCRKSFTNYDKLHFCRTCEKCDEKFTNSINWEDHLRGACTWY